MVALEHTFSLCSGKMSVLAIPLLGSFLTVMSMLRVHCKKCPATSFDFHGTHEVQTHRALCEGPRGAPTKMGFLGDLARRYNLTYGRGQVVWLGCVGKEVVPGQVKAGSNILILWTLSTVSQIVLALEKILASDSWYVLIVQHARYYIERDEMTVWGTDEECDFHSQRRWAQILSFNLCVTLAK